MKVRNTRLIQFDLEHQKVIIKATPLLEFEVDKDAVFYHGFATGYSGYALNYVDPFLGKIIHPLSAILAKQLLRYLEFVSKDLKYDYYRLPFEKFDAI